MRAEIVLLIAILLACGALVLNLHSARRRIANEGDHVLKGRRPKRFDEMAGDAVFPYQVGRLVGAADMAAHLLVRMEDQQAKDIGEKMQGVVAWFFAGTEEQLEPVPPAVKPEPTVPWDPPATGLPSP